MEIFGYFWPAIKNERDADDATRRGAWACFLLSAVMMVASIAGLQPLGVVEAIYFSIAALGIRAKSRIAAIAAFSSVLVNVVGALFLPARHASPAAAAMILCLLFANIRATRMLALWAQDPNDEPVPIGCRKRFDDGLMNRMPVLIWPKVKVAFYVVAAALLIAKALSIALGSGALAAGS